jgi:hypothetical protein
LDEPEEKEFSMESCSSALCCLIAAPDCARDLFVVRFKRFSPAFLQGLSSADSEFRERLRWFFAFVATTLFTFDFVFAFFSVTDFSDSQVPFSLVARNHAAVVTFVVSAKVS